MIAATPDANAVFAPVELSAPVSRLPLIAERRKQIAQGA
jgi:hypothetical protein